MLLTIATVLGLCSLSFCATYTTIDDVPKLNWDFIIVGGEHLIHLWNHELMQAAFRWHSWISSCKQADRKRQVQCTRYRSWTYVC